MGGEAVNHGCACFIQANDLDQNPVSTEFQHYFVQGSHS